MFDIPFLGNDNNSGKAINVYMNGEKRVEKM